MVTPPDPGKRNNTTSDKAPGMWGIAWALFLLALLVYLVTAKGFSDVNDAEAYYLVTKSLVERGAVDVEPELTEPSTLLYFSGRDGRLYAVFGVGFAVFSAPLYVAGRLAGYVAELGSPGLSRVADFLPRVMVTLGCAVVAAGSVALLYVLLALLGLSVRWAVATALLYGFATYVWAYSKIGFYDIHLTFFELAAIVCAVAYRKEGKGLWPALAGFALGWGIATRPSLILGLPALVSYVGWAGMKGERSGAQPTGGRLWRVAVPLGLFGIGFLPWVLIMAWYNLARTGSPWNLGYRPEQYALTREAVSVAVAFYAVIFSLGRGIFVYSPVLFLSLWGARQLIRAARPEGLLLTSTIALIGGFQFVKRQWDETDYWAWGPRYLLVVTPLVTVFVGFALAQLWKTKWGRRVVFALAAVSVTIQLLAIAVPFGTYLHYVKKTAGSPRVTVLNWRYCPILGQIHTLRRVRFERVPPEALTGGFVAEDVKMNLRHSLDFWFVYAYRLGVPGAVWLPLLTVVLAGIWLEARRLSRLMSRIMTEL